MENKALSPNSPAAADGGTRNSEHLSEQLADITAKVLRFTSAGGAAIAIVSGDAAVTRASSGDLAPDLDSRLRLDGSFAGLCISQGELLYCEDAETDPRVDSAASSALGIRSMVMVPIGEKGNVRGVLAAFAAISNGFRPTHIAVMRTLADIVHELLLREEPTVAQHSTRHRDLEPPLSSAKHTPESPVAPPPRPAVEPVHASSHITELPVELAKRLEVITGGAASASELKPAMLQTPAVVEPAPIAPTMEIPRPVSPVEMPKPLYKDRFERPESATPAPAPVPTSAVDAAEEKKPEKAPLPSIVALANQQKKAEQSSASVSGDILVSAADPLVKTPIAAAPAPARRPVQTPASKPLNVKTTTPTPVPSSMPVIESPMFRSLEQPASESGSRTKLVAAVLVALAVLIGAAVGVRQYLQSGSASTVATEAFPAATLPAEQAPAQPVGTTATGAVQPGATASTPVSKPETKPPATESAAAGAESSKQQASRPQPVIVADGGSIPRRTESIEAPQVALNGRADVGALLTTTKSATPTLSVKRSVLSPPEVIRRIPPKFPEFARRSNPAGDRVVLNVSVGKDGRVKNVQVVRGQPFFSESAVNAVKQWQYRPAFLNGEPVDATVEVVVSFTGNR